MSYQTRFQQALSKCDESLTYDQLCEAVEAHVRPILHELLMLPLSQEVSLYTSTDECCPLIVSARKWLSDNCSDDVWFFLYKIAYSCLDKITRKRTRNADPINVSSPIVNAFTLFCNHRLPNLESIQIRWRFLKKERSSLESSDNYVHCNASERRRIQMNSVLSVFSERAHRHNFTLFWLKCIDFAGAASLHAHLLYRLGTQILPSLTNPLVVSDYLSGCFNSGGLISVLALQGIFVLILDHGLEYPQYYDQLYTLISADVFASRHRYDLFKLLDLSMSSLRVSSSIAASYIKQTARVCLLCPSPCLYFALPFIRKVLQHHPNCLALIHRNSKEAIPIDALEDGNTSRSKDETAAVISQLFCGVDPYDASAKCSTSRALYSTLWELTALEHHYLPTVPLMVSAFSSTAEDKSALKFEKSYGRLFTAEVTRFITAREIPSLAYSEPLSLTEADAINL